MVQQGKFIADLPPEAFARYDNEPDEQFYQVPRLVTHIDERAIERVTDLYRTYIPAGGRVLDLMSSWVSHLPPEVRYEPVVGLGMNEEELRRNPRLDGYVVQNLNDDPRLPFDDAEFDAATICVSIQYLQQPAIVLREVGRVLTAGAPLIVTFSNRCFPTKAVMIWQALDMEARLGLIAGYLSEAGNWNPNITFEPNIQPKNNDPLYGVIGWTAG